jgi:hypothetical protein
METIRFVVYSHDLAGAQSVTVTPPTGWTVAASHARFDGAQWQLQTAGPDGRDLPNTGGPLNLASGWAHALDFTSPADFPESPDVTPVWPKLLIPAGIAAEVGTPNPPPKPHTIATLVRLTGSDTPPPPPAPPLTVFP